MPMKKTLQHISLFLILAATTHFSYAQQCLTTGYCTAMTNQYPTTTFSTTSSGWGVVSAYMNAGNWTLFNVTSGNVYEWSYCEAYGGVSTNWDAQLTLINNSGGANLCFSDNTCGTSGNAPYISWTATFTGVVKLVTTTTNCASNTGAPYNTLVWRMANGSAGSTQVLGIDVSHYDGAITWSQVKSAPKVFAWAKATEGLTNTDATFSTNATNGVAAGVYMGGYHFAHPETNSASAEASYFMSVAGTYVKACQLMPALDLEDPAGGPSLTSSMTSAALTSWVMTWMSAVKSQGGVEPILYTSGSIATYLGSSAHVYNLWIADPDGSSTANPTNIGGWPNWAFKQYSWTGTVPGISAQVDLNVFNGDINAFHSLIGCIATGVNEAGGPSGISFKVYPNPATEVITVENENPGSAQAIRVSVYDMQGQMLAEQMLSQDKISFDISSYSAGMYILRVQTPAGVEFRKFVRK